MTTRGRQVSVNPLLYGKGLTVEIGNPGRERYEVAEEEVECECQALRWREKENRILVTEGFEAVGGSLWEKEGIIFGRGAALQSVREKLREDEEAILLW